MRPCTNVKTVCFLPTPTRRHRAATRRRPPPPLPYAVACAPCSHGPPPKQPRGQPGSELRGGKATHELCRSTLFTWQAPKTRSGSSWHAQRRDGWAGRWGGERLGWAGRRQCDGAGLGWAGLG